MTVGKKVGQQGNAVPLSGGGGIRQISSGTDALTITINSSVTSTGMNALRIQRAPANDAAGSTGGLEIFDVEYDGMRGRRQVKTLSSVTATGAAGIIQLEKEDAGKFLIIPARTGATGGAGASDAKYKLPPVEQGLMFELYNIGTITTGVLQVLANSCGTAVVFDDSAADGVGFNKATGTVAVGGSVRCVSDGTKWVILTQPAFTSAAPTSLTMTSFQVIT